MSTTLPPLVTLTKYYTDYTREPDGEEIVIDRPVCYVGVYAITRHYGGPEEGGWWWNACQHVLSIPLIKPGDAAEIEEVKAFLAPRFENEGDINSVRGGVEFSIHIECEEGEDEDTNRPHYE